MHIERVESFNFLGITLSETVSWDNHACKFSKNENFKSNRNIKQIKKCIPRRNGKNLIYVHNCIVFELLLVTLGG